MTVSAAGSTSWRRGSRSKGDVRRVPGSINTVRIVTLTDEKGEPHPLYAFLRTGRGGVR